MASILRQGILLSAAQYTEQVIMLLTPVVLVRTIGPTAFGEYRLFWLLVTTVALLFSFNMPRSLLFFFVRLDAEGRRIYVGQTVLFLVATTTFALLLIVAFRHALPSGMKDLLHDHGLLLAIFLFVWNLGLTAAYAAFLMSLCDKRFTATQYALLTSLMAVTRVVAGAPTGVLAKAYGWETYFLVSALAAIPGLLLLLRYDRWKGASA